MGSSSSMKCHKSCDFNTLITLISNASYSSPLKVCHKPYGVNIFLTCSNSSGSASRSTIWMIKPSGVQVPFFLIGQNRAQLIILKKFWRSEVAELLSASFNNALYKPDLVDTVETQDFSITGFTQINGITCESFIIGLYIKNLFIASLVYHWSR